MTRGGQPGRWQDSAPCRSAQGACQRVAGLALMCLQEGSTAMPVSFSKTIPLFRIFDVGKAKEFYVGFLGFVVDWEHRFEDDSPTYMQVSRGDLLLHLTEHHGDACPGSTVFV